MSPLRPYREPGPVDPDPLPDPAPPFAHLGGLRSVHQPPPLHRVLVGPVLIAATLLGLGVLALDASVGIVAPFALLTLLLFAWTPLRVRGFSAELHDHGVVLARGAERTGLAFEDVNEVWFELDTFQYQPSAFVRALRLLDFSGKLHRVPLSVAGAPVLVDAVLRACSVPLLTEARKALAQGETLTFGPVQIDRTEITVGRARLAWSAIRLVVMQRGKVHVYRRFPILPWRTVRLDRVPNPTVFVGLVLASAAKVRVDDGLIVPFASAVESSAAQAARIAEGGNELALRTMLVGGVSFLAGVLITWATYSASNSSYVVAIGPIVFGALRFFQGLSAYRSGPRR